MVSEHSVTVSPKPDPTLASELPKMTTETELARSECGQIELQRSLKSLELAMEKLLQMVCERFGLNPCHDDSGNQVDANPEPQTDPQELQEQRIEVIGKKGPKDPVLGSMSSDLVIGGSVSAPSKQGKVKDDPDVQNISDEMFGLSSHPRISKGLNDKRSRLREKISVKRYHKARKKHWKPSAVLVSNLKAAASSTESFLGVNTNRMKKWTICDKKAKPRELVQAIKSYGMRFGFSYSGDRSKYRQIRLRRLINDICVKRGSIILDYGLQSQHTVIQKSHRYVELVWIRNSDPLLKELKLKRGLNTHTQMVIDDSWFPEANLRLGWKHFEEFSLHRDEYARYVWDTGQENDSMGTGLIQRFKEKSQGITISVQEDPETVECGGQVVGKNSGKHWIEAIVTGAELGSSENLTREIKDSVLVPKTILPISCRHEIEENCADVLSWSVRVWEPGGSVIVKILKWPEKYHHQDEGSDLNMGKEMKKESPSLDREEECSNDIKEQWLKMVLSEYKMWIRLAINKRLEILEWDKIQGMAETKCLVAGVDSMVLGNLKVFSNTTTISLQGNTLRPIHTTSLSDTNQELPKIVDEFVFDPGEKQCVRAQLILLDRDDILLYLKGNSPNLHKLGVGKSEKDSLALYLRWYAREKRQVKLRKRSGQIRIIANGGQRITLQVQDAQLAGSQHIREATFFKLSGEETSCHGGHVSSVLSSCDDDSTLRTRRFLWEEYQASNMAMTKVREWFFNEEGIGSDSVVRKGQYEEERDTFTNLVFYKTETLIDKEQIIGIILSLETDSMTAILDIKSGTLGKMVKYGDEWIRKDRLKWVKVQAGYKQLCGLRVQLAKFDGKDRKYKQVSVSDNGVKRETSSPTETSRKAGFQGYNGVYGFTLKDTRVKNVEEEVSDHDNGVFQSWCHRNFLDILCREAPYAVFLLNNIQTHHDIEEPEFHANAANIITLVRVAILYSVSLKRVIFIHGEYHSPRPPETWFNIGHFAGNVNTSLKPGIQCSTSSTLRTRLLEGGSIDKYLKWASVQNILGH